MPTINQLVRKSRKARDNKLIAPALQKGYNSLTKKLLMQVLQQKEEFVF